jgi:hypothetical protein
MWRSFSNEGARFDSFARNDSTYPEEAPPYSEEASRETSRQQPFDLERERWDRERQNLKRQLQEAVRRSERDGYQALERERERHAIALRRAEDNTEQMRSNMQSLLDQSEAKVFRLQCELDQSRTAHQLDLKRYQAQQGATLQNNFDLQDQLEQMTFEDPLQSEQTTEYDEDYDTLPVWANKYSLSLNSKDCCFVGPADIQK